MEPPEPPYHEVLTLYRSGQLTEAISKLEILLKQHPDFQDGFETLVVFYSKSGRLDDAINAMKCLVKLAPGHIMAHTNLSRFYVEKGMILEAEQEQAEARRLSWKAELKAQKSNPGDSQRSPQE